MTPAKSDTLWTRAFVLLCIVQFLGYAQHFVLQPTLPIYVTHLGATPFVVGLVMASFAATSMILRPLVGYWSDRWSESGVMISGLLIQGASVLLCYLPFVGTTMLANSCRGVGWASVNSGGYALLAQSAPVARRGEAAGYYSGAQGSATILLPAVALWLIDAPFGGFRVVFAVSMTLAIAGAALGLLLRQRGPNVARQRRYSLSGPWWREIVRIPDKDILLASGLLFGLQVSLPAVAGFLVLHARQLGIEHFGWYYIASGATSLIARPLLGQLSDRVGRGAAVGAGFILEASAFSVVVNATTLGGMIASGVLYMLGNAIGSSATLALALEHADPERRGQVIATYSMAYPLSAGVGSMLAGSAIQIAGYTWMFIVIAMINIPGLWVTWKNRVNLK